MNGVSVKVRSNMVSEAVRGLHLLFENKATQRRYQLSKNNEKLN
jgi:hypothetical protein